VELRYPVNGVITGFSLVTDANGFFSFSNVPFGVRSLAVTSAPTLGPKPIRVDNSQGEVPIDHLNYFGSLQTVTYVTGTRSESGPGNSYIDATLNSGYSLSKQLAFLTVSWTGDGFLTGVMLNGTLEAVANLVSGTRFGIVSALTFPPSSDSSLELRFAKFADGTGNVNMNGSVVALTLEWTSGGNQGAVTLP
jgi:hypothetical protein